MSDHPFIPKSNSKIVPPFIPKPKESLEAENARLKAEVERLKGIILAQSSEFVRNATKQKAEPLPDGWNSAVAKACDILAEKEKEIRLWREAGELMLDHINSGFTAEYRVVEAIKAAKDNKQPK